eukprot:1190283-Prorocentrum_minimum.AAC.1
MELAPGNPGCSQRWRLGLTDVPLFTPLYLCCGAGGSLGTLAARRGAARTPPMPCEGTFLLLSDHLANPSSEVVPFGRTLVNVLVTVELDAGAQTCGLYVRGSNLERFTLFLSLYSVELQSLVPP